MYIGDVLEFRKDGGFNDDSHTAAAAVRRGRSVLVGRVRPADGDHYRRKTKYPIFRHYTTRQEMSDLGGTRPPQGLVTQPSAMIFDTTMIIAGVLLLAGAFALWRLYLDRVLTVVSALLVGELGDNSPVAKSIGMGGVERWVVFPIILWLAFFGGHLLASRHRRQPDRHGPAATDGSTGARADPRAVVPTP
jgi:hypothetical protein